jgi:hypothetical protein
VLSVDEHAGRAAGALQAIAKSADPVDAALVID